MSDFDFLNDKYIPVEIREKLKGKQENLRKIRIALGLEIKEVALKIGIAGSTISKIENGDRNISRKKFLELVNFYQNEYNAFGFILNEPTAANIIHSYNLVKDGKITDKGKEILKILAIYI